MTIESQNSWTSKLIDVSTKVLLPIFALFIIGFYFFKLGKNDLSGDGAEWGAFGSYVGGILSPLIAAAALIWLIKSVTMQKTELQATQEVLTKQLDQTTKQAFEGLLFSLLETKNKVTNDIRETYKVKSKKELFEDLTYLFIKSPYTSWTEFYSAYQTGFLDSYFRINYHILKYINDSDIPNKKKYADIYRATLSKFELNIIFYNCIGYLESDKYKILVEKFGLFEPLRYTTNEADRVDFNPATRYAYQYKIEAFENNKIWINYFIKSKKIETICIKSLINSINTLSTLHCLDIIETYYITYETGPIKNTNCINKINREKILTTKNMWLLSKKRDIDSSLKRMGFLKSSSYVNCKHKKILHKSTLPFKTSINTKNIYLFRAKNINCFYNTSVLYMKIDEIEIIDFIIKNKIQFKEYLKFYNKI